MPRQGGAEGSLSTDVYEEGDNLIVEAHLPGFKPENLDVNVERGVLTMNGQTEQTEPELWGSCSISLIRNSLVWGDPPGRESALPWVRKRHR